MVETQDWQEIALTLRGEGKSANEAAEVTGKHPATIRKLFARNPVAETNGNGNGHDPIPGQTTVDDHLADRIVWTGENRTETAMFLGRGENGTIHAMKIDLPTGDEGRFVQVRPGDTIIRTGEHTYDVERPEDDPDHPGWAGKDEFEAEAGEAVGDMPKPPEPDPLGSEVRVRGTRQLAIDFGPFAQLPSGGTLVLKSERMASGHFGMGDLISGTFTARITDVGGKERFDKDFEEFRAKPTSYVATITEVEFD